MRFLGQARSPFAPCEKRTRVCSPDGGRVPGSAALLSSLFVHAAAGVRLESEGIAGAGFQRGGWRRFLQALAGRTPPSRGGRLRSRNQSLLSRVLITETRGNA